MGKMTVKLPLVSVIIPVFNGEKTSKAAIDSILTQTYQNIEIIIINDGSTDNTSDILKEYENEIVCKTQQNNGPSAARNTGIEVANGEYIAYQDADDISYPDRIEQEIECLLGNPSLGMVFSGVEEIRDFGKSVVKIPRSHSNFLLLQNNYIPCTTVMHKKSVLDVVGTWNENIDWDLWIRISEKFEIGYMKVCLCEYRKTKSGISSKRGRLKNRLIDLQMFKDRYKRKKEFWIRFKTKRIGFECKLLRIIRFKNKKLEIIFWYGFQTFSNMIEKVIYIVEQGVKNRNE